MKDILSSWIPQLFYSCVITCCYRYHRFFWIRYFLFAINDHFAFGIVARECRGKNIN